MNFIIQLRSRLWTVLEKNGNKFVDTNYLHYFHSEIKTIGTSGIAPQASVYTSNDGPYSGGVIRLLVCLLASLPGTSGIAPHTDTVTDVTLTNILTPN